MKASVKDVQIENLLTSITGKDRSQTIQNNLCVTCDKDVREFSDPKPLPEYQISGMCQECQNSVFGVPSGPNQQLKPSEEFVGLRGDVFVVDRSYRMVSGAAEAAEFVYHKAVDNR